MISINLLDYEQALKKVAMQKIIINTIGAVLFFIFLMVGYWCFQKIEIRYRANELKQLEGQVRGLTTETTKIQSMKLQAKRTKKIIKKINELRANQFQVTQILEDLILPVPDEIWLTSVRQLGVKEVKGKKIPLILIGDPKKMRSEKKSNKSNNKVRSKQEFLEVRGRLFGKHSDETIVRYIDRLRDSSSFAKVFLHQTSQQQTGTKAVRDFTFYVYMPMKA
jgi:Tfp pilus assembly protein PilN